jgi:hypothetical protein
MIFPTILSQIKPEKKVKREIIMCDEKEEEYDMAEVLDIKGNEFNEKK